MDSIEIDGQAYRVLSEKEIGAGRHHRKEALCTDAADKKFLLWTESEETSAIVGGTFQLVSKHFISKHFIAELTNAQVELWKTGNFETERATLKGRELNLFFRQSA
jgi:hypothetical protein